MKHYNFHLQMKNTQNSVRKFMAFKTGKTKKSKALTFLFQVIQYLAN